MKISIQSVRGAWICAAIFLVTIAVYFQTRTFGFVNYDDPDYVTANEHIRSGITWEGLGWAFTSGDYANWFPVTRLSHMLDCQLFGLDSGAHHLSNAFFHAVAALFLFLFLERATHARWPSAFVALVFALHPLHVESVAWISERKDVLCALFWFLALWAYVRYSERPAPARYLLVVAAFCLGLMSKPMIVTLPFVLILLDFWPLNRGVHLVEKLPLFGLAAISSAITVMVQRGSGAVESLAAIPLPMRIENAALSYIRYIADTLWPVNLAVFYPYPVEIPTWQPILAGLAILGVSALVVVQRRSRPYLAAGWFWFLGTLVPAIGLVQVGTQAHADRYMYVPIVGLAIMAAWGASEFLDRWPAISLLPLALIPLTWMQTGYWQDSGTLFSHALAVTKNNALAEHNLGSYLLDQPDRLPDATMHLEAALRLNPDSASIRSDFGSALAKSGRLPEAIGQFQAALKLDPESTVIRANLSNAQLESSRTDGPEAHYNKGIDFLHAARYADAVEEFQAALRLKPDYAEAENNLGVALAEIPARVPESFAHFEAALKLDPNSADAHVNYGIALSQIPGRMPEAIAQLEAGYRLHPDPELRQTLDRLRSGH